MLEHFFGSKTRVKLLQLFFRAPQKIYYVRELGRITKTQLNAVRREVANLNKIGIIREVDAEQATAETTGTKRSKYFQLDPNFLLYPELKALLLKSELLEQKVLIESVQAKAGAIDLLILTGIFTGAEDVETDMLLVGQIKPVIFSKIIKDHEGRSGNSVRYTIMDRKEFNERKQIGDKFLYTIFESKNMPVIDEVSGL